jgi:hypothetical protein
MKLDSNKPGIHIHLKKLITKDSTAFHQQENTNSPGIHHQFVVTPEQGGTGFALIAA